MRIVTKKEAIDSGMSASQIRTVARSLQRIASKGYDSVEVPDEDGGFDRVIKVDSYIDPRTLRKNAALLFKLARTM